MQASCMDAKRGWTSWRGSGALSGLPGQLALLALAGWFGLLVGTAFSPQWGADAGARTAPSAAKATAAPRSPAPRSLYPESAGSPPAITETIAIEGGYAVLRFEPTYRVVAVTASTGSPESSGSPLAP